MINWWLEIKTIVPPYTYYFCPFSSREEAKLSESGYIEDLLQEKAHGITVEVKRFRPKELTIDEN